MFQKAQHNNSGSFPWVIFRENFGRQIDNEFPRSL